MRLSLVSFALAVASLGLAQHQARQEHPSVNPPSSSVTQIDWAAYDAATSAPDEPSTNAQRFARGLPPLKPRAHRRSAHRGAPLRLGTRVRSAPPADTSPSPPIKQDCNILVKKGDGTTLGFISPTLNVFGEYGTFQETQADALLVAFSYQPNSLNQLDMFATNSPTTSFPYVGGVVGYSSSDDDMGPGNSNYAYVAGVKQTPVGPAQVGDSSFGSTTGRPADYESAIWAYNPTTQAITAQWVNTDESVVDTRFLYTDDGNAALLITGDPDKLNTFLGSTYPEVTFVCVPPTATPLPK